MHPDDDGPRSGSPDVLAGVPDAVYRLDSRGRFSYLNAAAEALLERRAKEVLGAVVQQLLRRGVQVAETTLVVEAVDRVGDAGQHVGLP